MVTTLDDTKRSAIATELADLKILQNLLISNEETLLSAINDQEIRNRFQKIIEDDRKNIGVLDTVIVQYGVKGEPRNTVKKFVDHVRQTFEGSELSLYQKVSQLELLKHKQVTTGLLIHKAAQVVGADVAVAIAPLNTINFENRAHQEQLKGIIEVLGVRELTGKDADQGIWGRVQDAIAAFSGVVGSAVTQSSDKQDLNIQDLIRLDHNKVNTIFTEIAATDDPQKLQEYFGQLYKDLSVHAQAEEQTVYPKVRSFYGNNDTQELYDEQADMKRRLDEIKALSPSSPAFKDKIKQLADVVGDHVRQEESTLFASIDKNCSTEQKEQIATEFKSAKSKIQDELAASSK